MGAVEEGGKVAAGVVDSLSGSPLTLAVVVINVLFLVFVGWVGHTISSRNERRDDQIERMLKELEHSCDSCMRKQPTAALAPDAINWLEVPKDADCPRP